MRFVAAQLIAVALLFLAPFSQAIASQTIDAVATHHIDMQHGDNSTMQATIDCDQGFEHSGNTDGDDCRDICERICAQQFSEYFTNIYVTGRYSKDVAAGWTYEAATSFGGVIEDRPPRTN
ncbi:hypothetical protein [Ahrensia sp. 13_GOM-1096m]|uniref:hypothetical protein n=1 Tax=Ahrensia sp. 13_GOM-1096m TaxID=1380380 RepID=UPI00047AFB90|nr:hypothetical protein [Ahrensia sp. 13_GOM-1096m]